MLKPRARTRARGPGHRILMLLSDGFGGRGGIAKFNRDFLRALCSYPRTERVIALPRLAPDPLPQLPENLDYRLSGLGGLSHYAAALAKLLAREQRIDFVVCGHIHLLPLAAAPVARFHAPNTLIVHGIDAWQPTDRRLANRLVPHVDSFVSVSDYTKQRFLAWAKLQSERGYVLPNCVEVARFTPGPKRPELLARYGLEGRVVLLTVSRLSTTENKGVDKVIECLPRLTQQIPNLSYLIVGEGPDRKRLEALSVRCGVRDRVVFAGYVPEHEKVDHYRIADTYVMPSRGEGFGIVFIEAMACGIPTVASTRDASSEAIRDSELGLLVDPHDPESVANGILRALSLPRGERPAAIDYFSSERFDARVHATLDRLLPTQDTTPAGARSSRGPAAPEAPPTLERHEAGALTRRP